MSNATRDTTHQLVIDAPAGLVFTLLRSSSHWPDLEGLTVYAEQISGDDLAHETRISVAAHGGITSTNFQRVIDPERRRIHFKHSSPDAPTLRTAGSWQVDDATQRPSTGPASSVVTLNHEYQVEDSSAEVQAWILETIDEYAQRELEALRRSCERLASLMKEHAGADEPRMNPAAIEIVAQPDSDPDTATAT
ncbi:hypothetical protein [Arthrobacter bambusae]|uniref:hypothetical protein n=1 Tax=Arthrobacter bambusae TaxID=1338426 RepID=UPI002786C301|nr:hypothetical protein [Arthrobacter bambusae]MDQ0028646.1 HAMP domain-containing protein [Arthrobacter bambusae]MDQ0096560.1 HAMP domain-containing protein [Arthrobacter bambusae]